MYINNRQDFPNEIFKSHYREKLSACYPIHPQIFDFLYGKWTSLENFHKTRGVLRLMAKVIFSLWNNHDMNTLIMPGTIPLDDSSVRDELTDILGKGNWDAIVQSEIAGKKSKAYNLDKFNPRFQRFSSARKISRSIFMGTAPDQKKSGVRGISENDIHLCTIQPTEIENIAVFNDALAKLRTNLYYLYSQGDKLWFGENASLRRTVDDKRAKYSDDEIFSEIESRLKTWRNKNRGKFKAVHVCPKNSGDVPDEQTARLVILSPKNSFDATTVARNFLDTRGTAKRNNQNMLVFLAADTEKLHALKDVVREFKAWTDIKAEARILNITAVQDDEVTENIKSSTKKFSEKLSQTYCRLIYPVSDDNRSLTLPLRDEKIECANEENISVASAKFVEDEKLLPVLGGGALKRLLDDFIWNNSEKINVKQLWEYFTKYYYMPRLVDEKVLFDAIRRGVRDEIFAVADDENFSNLQFSKVSASVGDEKFLVKASKARELIGVEESAEPETETESETIEQIDETPTPQPQPEVETLPTKFIMDTALDNTRIKKNFNACFEEIISLMTKLPNAQTEVRISVNISVPEGIPKNIRDEVESNCRRNEVTDAYFEV